MTFTYNFIQLSFLCVEPGYRWWWND